MSTATASREGLFVYPDTAAITAAATQLTIDAAERAVRTRGVFHWALSGGSTPKALYQRLASAELRGSIAWDKVHTWFGDERCYAPDHADSNFRMAREALIDPLSLPAERVHRIRGEAPDRALETARFAEEVVRQVPSEGGWPRFDLVLLGMGADGHTASLFPGTGAAAERAVVALPVVPGAYVKPQIPRISLSAPVIQNAREILVLIGGADKAEALKDVLDGPLALDHRPLQLVRQAQGKVRWLLDAAAAARL
jgi:6-phosphogluconolactonase